MLGQQRPAKVESAEGNRRRAPARKPAPPNGTAHGLARILAGTPADRLGETVLAFALDRCASRFGILSHIEEAGEPDGVNDYAEIWLEDGGAAPAPERTGRSPSPVAERPEPGICNRPYVLAAGP